MTTAAPALEETAPAPAPAGPLAGYCDRDGPAVAAIVAVARAAATLTLCKHHYEAHAAALAAAGWDVTDDRRPGLT